MYGACVRIPTKSPGHSEMRSPGVRCLLADRFVASGAVILALEPRAWAQQAASERALLRAISRFSAVTGRGSTKRTHRKAAGAFFERGPLCRYPRFRSQRFWHREEDALLTGARRRLWPGEIDPVRVVDHAIEKARRQCHELLGKKRKEISDGIATNKAYPPRSATSNWIDFRLVTAEWSNTDTRIPI